MARDRRANAKAKLERQRELQRAYQEKSRREEEARTKVAREQWEAERRVQKELAAQRAAEERARWRAWEIERARERAQADAEARAFEEEKRELREARLRLLALLVQRHEELRQDALARGEDVPPFEPMKVQRRGLCRPRGHLGMLTLFAMASIFAPKRR